MAITSRTRGKAAAERGRARRGTGSIRQRGETYTCYWFVLDPATGKRRQQSKGGFASQEDAQEHLTSVLAEVQSGTWRRDEKLTVTQLFDDYWLPVKRSQNKAANTIAHHEYVARGVKARIGGLPVDTLKPVTIAKMVQDMQSEGLSVRSRQAAVNTLKAATSWATRSRLIGSDPIEEYARISSKSSGALKAWDLEQARAFLASVADDRYAACWTLLVARGLRRGELAGLRWSDVNLDRCRLTVNRTRVVVNGSVTEAAPKTDQSARTIPLDDLLVSMLSDLRTKQEAEAEAGTEYGYGCSVDVNYVMSDELGRPMHPDSISRRFDQLVTKASLPRLTVHGLRHTAATLMLADGVPTKVVSEMLGHSSTSITLQTYAHVLPGMAEEAGAALSKSLLD